MLKKMVMIASIGGLFVTSCKKKETEVVTPANLSPETALAHQEDGPHLCIDKELSDETHRTEAAIYTSKQWQTGQTIRIKFLNGDATLQTRVKNAAAGWLQYANVKFQYVTASETADIRIAFKFNGDPGSWSYIGTDCQRINQSQATMNFGWFTSSSSDTEIRRTTLHEFGHALGLIHEQSSPAASINWNKEAVYSYYTGAPNYWTRQDVDNNVFAKVSASVTNYTAFDPQSIMQYAVPAAFTTDGVSIGNNTVLSETDKYFIGQRYPFAITQRNVLYTGQQLGQNQSLLSTDGRLKLILQTDGNLVLYKFGTQPIWASNTAGKSYITRLTMQSDGNLVLQDNAGTRYWQTATNQYPGGFLLLENTGSAVVYQNGIKRWSTNTVL